MLAPFANLFITRGEKPRQSAQPKGQIFLNRSRKTRKDAQSKLCCKNTTVAYLPRCDQFVTVAKMSQSGCIPLYAIVCHCIPLCTIVYDCIQLFAYHCIPLYTVVCDCTPLYAIAYRCLYTVAYRCIHSENGMCGKKVTPDPSSGNKDPLSGKWGLTPPVEICHDTPTVEIRRHKWNM